MGQAPLHYASQPPSVFIGYTTVASKEQAEQLVQALLTQHLAACVQIEGPIQSFYIWEGRKENSTEYRMVIKFRIDQANALERHLHAHHPYAIPQWVAVPAYFVGGKYLSWLQESPTP